MRLVFAGTPEFAVAGLHACIDAGAQVVAAYTQPDRPAGRGRKLSASPVKQAARAAGIPVEQPASLKAPEVQQRLRDYAPDLLVVIAYGLIVPRTVLAIPPLGGWNIHASLLPRWRGAAPIQRALLAGDRKTGVCLMQMDAGLDTGPVLVRETLVIRADDTGGSLHDRLAAAGARLLGAALRRAFASAALPATPQAADGAVYAHKLDKAEARLDFTRPATELERKVRAFNPWPVAEAKLAGERVRVWAAQVLAVDAASTAPAGSVLGASKHGIDIACGEGALRILKLQRPGGRAISAADYLNARPELRRP
ncbi:MAG: methionyl-tRNA formyltransferase [Rhodanobacteraceae bacterium]|nr:MAG: methionyl-tRNA formyltransferase [Rhodanobacteraceae bacterium]